MRGVWVRRLRRTVELSPVAVRTHSTACADSRQVNVPHSRALAVSYTEIRLSDILDFPRKSLTLSTSQIDRGWLALALDTLFRSTAYL